ncbi:HD-GYP domain-containing protein [Thalassotalea profundi]|uniref:Phosphodiesterase n=1 Tax=Thalassotalea profundi TaxID=2036687 RepID=A0ABQ3ILA8_9GAMM|nr:HD-GYP domain-containing protein [Thalassotalea profundi]GHE87757.1 phosphodiesterase [Thalassotalea profundi]
MTELITLSINDLKVGMFVKDIILKNSDHKVKNQGVVNSERTIALLKKQGVDKVVVELQPEQLEALEKSTKINSNNINKNESSDTDTKKAAGEHHKAIAPTSVDQELEHSHKLYQEANDKIKSLFLQASKGQKISTDGIEELAIEIMQSVMRNEYAIAILTRIRHHSTYQWEHTINCAIHMCGFSLFLGIKPDLVQQITLGALLHDIGTAKVPEGIIAKPDSLSTNELSVVKKHTIQGIEICKREGFTSPIITDMTMNHHERLDGSGYPRGLSKDKLSKLARMMAIVDVYDAMTGEKNYKKALQPLNVFRYLISSNTKFDPNIVQQFIKYLGVHPVGSVVQLSDERLAMVMHGNRDEPLKPKVKVFFNTQTMHYIKPKDADLSIESITITSAVDANDFEISTQKVIKDFIN